MPRGSSNLVSPAARAAFVSYLCTASYMHRKAPAPRLPSPIFLRCQGHPWFLVTSAPPRQQPG
ncbi:hypothetical protein C1H46_023432 [Malus baccata]|uniref:Uncharacterized protein n=1 Tax=Malus baccata TaxID=106549 RepID=A0A540LWY8_MALBA|nr:hypothetical protein C1H46_023432 [Malus baccata]